MNIIADISKNINAVCAEWAEELKLIFKDEGLLIFLILLPLTYPIIYSWIYNNEIVREVPVAVVDNSHSRTSLCLINKFDASPDVEVAYRCNDVDEARQLLGKQEIYGVIYIPEDFETRLNRMEQSTISIYANMAFMLTYKAIFQTATAVTANLNSEIQISLSGNYTERENEILTQPLKIEETAIFNNTGGYGNFILPGVLVLIIQQVLLLGVGMNNGTRYERLLNGNTDARHEIQSGLSQSVIGKTLCYFMLFALISTYVLLAVPKIFNFVQIPRIPQYIQFVIPYLLSCIFFAMTVSFFVRQRENVILIVVFTSIIFLFMSGMSWPQSNIPKFWEIFSYIFPSTFGIHAFIRINTMGAEYSDIATECRNLWIQAGVYFITACLVYRDMRKKQTRAAKE